jgi:hypothetical protein
VIDSLEAGTVYFWKVMARNLSGDSLFSSEINGFFVSHIINFMDNSELENPIKFKLHNNYPNPFNSSTNIVYRIGKPGLIQMAIYDLNGQLVDILVKSWQSPGLYTIPWHAGSIASGIYFYQLRYNDGVVDTKQLLLLK